MEVHCQSLLGPFTFDWAKIKVGFSPKDSNVLCLVTMFFLAHVLRLIGPLVCEDAGLTVPTLE